MDRPYFRNGNLKIREDFQQEGFEFLVGLVHFIHQKNRAFLMLECFQQRPRLQKMPGEEDVVVLVQFGHGGAQTIRAG